MQNTTLDNAMSMEFVKKICKKCNQERKFAKGSLRDIESICGNCWDWEEEAKKWPQCPRCSLYINPEMFKERK